MSGHGYTVVQHSACGYKQDPTFARGLEARKVSTEAELNSVVRVGGLVFRTYSEAVKFAERAPYPEGYVGIIPSAPGIFAHSKVDGLRIYIPAQGES